METPFAVITTILALAGLGAAFGHWAEAVLTRVGIIAVLAGALVVLISLLYLRAEGIIR
jgi:hypothetical protein